MCNINVIINFLVDCTYDNTIVLILIILRASPFTSIIEFRHTKIFSSKVTDQYQWLKKLTLPLSYQSIELKLRMYISQWIKVMILAYLLQISSTWYDQLFHKENVSVFHPYPVIRKFSGTWFGNCNAVMDYLSIATALIQSASAQVPFYNMRISTFIAVTDFFHNRT